jgi:hypothetical protein
MSKARKPERPPLGRRLGERVRSAGLIGADAVRNPRNLPGIAHGAVRNWFRRIWESRGGGVYTLGYALTFAWLELKAFVVQVAGMSSVEDFIVDELLHLVIRFGTDSIANLVTALIWPLYLLQWRQPWGVLLLGLAFFLYPVVAKPLIEKWLNRDDTAPE